MNCLLATVYLPLFKRSLRLIFALALFSYISRSTNLSFSYSYSPRVCNGDKRLECASEPEKKAK